MHPASKSLTKFYILYMLQTIWREGKGGLESLIQRQTEQFHAISSITVFLHRIWLFVRVCYVYRDGSHSDGKSFLWCKMASGDSARMLIFRPLLFVYALLASLFISGFLLFALVTSTMVSGHLDRKWRTGKCEVSFHRAFSLWHTEPYVMNYDKFFQDGTAIGWAYSAQKNGR